jgi:hypothetical protein
MRLDPNMPQETETVFKMATDLACNLLEKKNKIMLSSMASTKLVSRLSLAPSKIGYIFSAV